MLRLYAYVCWRLVYAMHVVTREEAKQGRQSHNICVCVYPPVSYTYRYAHVHVCVAGMCRVGWHLSTIANMRECAFGVCCNLRAFCVGMSACHTAAEACCCFMAAFGGPLMVA